MKKLISLITITTIALLFTACGGDNSKGKQNPSKNSLVNTTPKALNQTLTLNEDNSIKLTLKGKDEDNDTLGFKVTKKPTHGKLEGKAPNLTYIPNKDYNGIDNFNFIVNDGLEDSNEATITLNITPINDAPIAKDDKITLDEDTNIIINPLSNDSDVDIQTNQDRVTITNITQPQNGKAKIKNNTIIYTPNQNFNGKDSITYTIEDKNKTIAKATIDITINPINDAPIAKDDNITTEQAKAITINPLSNDSDVDIKTNQDKLTITKVKTSNSAKAVIKNNTQILYIPNRVFFGKDSITYTIKDKAGARATAKIDIDVKEHPYITKLSISTNKSKLNIDESDTITTVATYSNNTTKEIKDNIEWIVTPTDAIDITKNKITAIKDTNVTIQAKLTNFLNQTITSNPHKLQITNIPTITIPDSLTKALNETKIPYNKVTLKLDIKRAITLSAINKTIKQERNATYIIKGYKNSDGFYLYNIPLTNGENIITLKATSQSGESIEKNITIDAEIKSLTPIRLKVDKFEAIKELQEDIEVITPIKATKYLLDIDKDGIIDQTSNSNTFTIHLTKEGRYKPRVTLVTDSGVMYSTNPYALSLDVKANANQKDPKGAEPIDVAKEFVEAIKSGDRARVEELTNNNKLVEVLFGNDKNINLAKKVYSNIIKYTQEYTPIGANVEIEYKIDGKIYDGGIEFMRAAPQLYTGKIWLIESIY